MQTLLLSKRQTIDHAVVVRPRPHFLYVLSWSLDTHSTRKRDLIRTCVAVKYIQKCNDLLLSVRHFGFFVFMTIFYVITGINLKYKCFGTDRFNRTFDEILWIKHWR